MNIKALSMVILCTLFTAIGQIFFKFASSSISTILWNPSLYIGLVLYFAGAVFLTLALHYDKLSSVYPFIALSFVWVFILGITIFNEVLNIVKILGTFLILEGVFMVGDFR